MRTITPHFAPAFPPPWCADDPAAVTIGRPRVGRWLMRLELHAYGAEPVTVKVWAPLQRVAWRAAVMFARLRHFGPTRRITDYKIGFIYEATP